MAHVAENGGSCGYCENHMTTGDPSIYAFHHSTIPALGKVLAAARDLPQGYRFVFWGTLKEWDPNEPAAEWAMDFWPHKGIIDPTEHPGSKMQFAPNPGPNETHNLVHVKGGSHGHCKSVMKNRPRKTCTCSIGRLIGREMNLRRPVAKNEQITFRSSCASTLRTEEGESALYRRVHTKALLASAMDELSKPCPRADGYLYGRYARSELTERPPGAIRVATDALAGAGDVLASEWNIPRAPHETLRADTYSHGKEC
ncbi:hypothetical protein AB1Y20_016074 [Prymnesium parvum]|uniref:Uncharacterized protein n=1 Tax=Prymnesium parvum TaxID=97485 RepID=A0AB34JZK7_PRYPA